MARILARGRIAVVLRWALNSRPVSVALKDLHRADGGFSLIEIMVALAIAGILYFVALPGYQYALVKSGRVAAEASLMDLSARQEQFFVSNKQYAIDLASLGLPDPYYVDSQAEAVGRAPAVYRVDLDLVDGAYEGATAWPVNRQAADKACMAFSLSRLGIRAVSGAFSSSPSECW